MQSRWPTVPFAGPMAQGAFKQTFDSQNETRWATTFSSLYGFFSHMLQKAI